jgi:beta-galactosidase
VDGRRWMTRTLVGGVLVAMSAGLLPGAPAAAQPVARPAGGDKGLPPASGTPVAHHLGGTYDLDRDWRFALVSTDGNASDGPYADAADPSFDDSSWRHVDVPHDWSIEQTPTPPTAGAQTTSGTGFFPGGLGWYRKTFTLPRSFTGKRLSVEFDGVYMDSSVYLNGRLLGVHPYGYTGFSLDLTGGHTDGRTPNVLAVRVRNQIPSSRWYSGSGIYRNVRLVVTEPVHVRRWGTYVTTPGLAPSGSAPADVRIATTVDGGSGSGTPVQVEQIVTDARGVRVGRAATTVSVPTTGATAAVTVRVPRPVRWDVNHPYLYGVTTRLLVRGAVIDTYRTRFGIRSTAFDPQGGFWLNGRRLKIQGVDLHHDQGPLGAAVNADAITRQLTIMKSMGVNAVRTAHNPPAPELVALADRLGILLMVEAFDVWNVSKVPYDYARFFDEWSDRDISEMVNESKNSPSVIMWSIGNEIPNSTSASGVPIARRLIADVRSIDTTRPVVIGSDKYRSVPAPGSPAEQILLMLDGVGLNYNTAESIDALHARYPHTFFFESESSSETSTRSEYDQPEQPNTGENYTPGRRSASSFDNNLAPWTMSGEYSLLKDQARPWYLGQFLWSGFDYIGEPTPFDVFPVKTSFFGAVDTAGFAKDQYWLFRSQWTARPMVHLVPMDVSTDETDVTQVWAYTNADSVELFRNGRSLGVRRFGTGAGGSGGHLHLTWSVAPASGRLVAVARRNGRVVARDQVVTPGPPAALRLVPDRRVLPANGRSLSYVTVQVVDAAGRLVTNGENLVRFWVIGARLVGVDNGREESAERYKAPARTAFGGLALAVVQAGRTPGRVTVRAASAGLRGARAVLTAVPAQRQGPALSAAVGPVVPPVPDRSPAADASFSGTADTVPATMVDGNPATAWSDAYTQEATALLPAISAARPRDWVSVRCGGSAPVGSVRAAFVVDAKHALPASIGVRTWNGSTWRPAGSVTVTWTGTTATIRFAPVRTAAVRLDLTSSHPEAPDGFLGISELSCGSAGG